MMNKSIYGHKNVVIALQCHNLYTKMKPLDNIAWISRTLIENLLEWILFELSQNLDSIKSVISMLREAKVNKLMDINQTPLEM